VSIALAVLCVPTVLLAYAPGLAAFAVLRIVQGLFMSAAFALTLSYLAEQCSAEETAGAFAAYITGNVASNLVGRLAAAAAVDHFGLVGNFYLFALLNLSGAALVYFGLGAAPPAGIARPNSPFGHWLGHLRNARLRVSFAIGFLILFAFIGTFTYVNFVLVRPPLSIGMMSLGLVYLVFLPSVVTTPLAGRAVTRYGTRPVMWAALLLALVGLPLLLVAQLDWMVTGLALVAVGTFFAQATATGFVGRAATVDHGSASGLYLASYFLGGLMGAAVLGLLFDRFGWAACVCGIGCALGAAALLATSMQTGKRTNERTAPAFESAR
jgi:predicted MFS family arabinose efflux permease